MADETSVAAGKRFSQDMKRIREDRDVSVDEIHAETRIARSLIQSFEEGGLYEHPTFNEVYLRSFVQAYAEAIGVSPDAVLDALNDALAGEYDDALSQQYLTSPPSVDDAGEDPSPSTADDSPSPPTDRTPEDRPRSDTPAAGGPEGRGGLVGPPRALGEEPSAEETPSSTADPGEPGSESSEPSPDEQEEGSPVQSADEDAPEEPSSGAPSAPSAEPDDADAPEPADEESEAEEDETPDPGDEEDDTSRPDEEDEVPEEEEDRPSWMEERPEEEADETPPTGQAPPEPARSGDAAAVPPSGPGETGIVGEPTEMGSDDGATPPSEAGQTARPSTAPERRSRRRSTWDRLLRGEQRELLWGGVGVALILVVLVGLGVAYFSAGSSPQGDASATTASETASSPASAEQTTTDSAATASTPEPPPATVTLGESIALTVLATGNVSEIRIERDEDLRRPYWISEGDAEVFPFQQRVTIQNELDDVRLFVAGYPYPVSPEDTVGGIEITRSQAEAFVDTLRGAPTTLSVTPDTIPVGVPEQ
jgi:cytoskeletal protein RodZ